MKQGYRETIHVPQMVATILDTNVETALISQRDGQANTKLSYLRGDVIANYLNEAFGPLGWELESKIDRIDTHEAVRKGYQGAPDKDVFVVQVVTTVTLTIKPTVTGGTSTSYSQQGVGYGEVGIDKQRKEAYNMAVKGADTDGLKRAASFLGRRLGMFLIDGEQDDISYAHNAGKEAQKKASRNKASKDRDRDIDQGLRFSRYDNKPEVEEPAAGGEPAAKTVPDKTKPAEPAAADEGRGRREPEAETARAGGSEKSGAASGKVADKAPRDREDADRDERRDDKTREADGKGDAGRQTGERDPAPAKTTTKADRNQEEKPTTKAGSAKGGTAKPAPDIDENYNLQHIPVTRDEMISYAATLVKQVKEMHQEKDQVRMLKQHANTIRNVLDNKIRMRVEDLLVEAGIDVDAALA